ncbi:hypothetical protein G7K_5144-t1 [Saitoella complicata NRRL Y-17804]|uniref:MULE transposase domain-containing protein n=1 Tax=Saitoella complicata (strain BCRC 22490 / CBS 7301 / JCM 7358 / NBRC 10748 / NRRL Y-17804) TaxID=698492 RepID=A0A0E9NMC9_SAICN|nr:hypothetical protein G7K_5144-t1 [Saitoella complicata NRRL Y-17804]
MDPPPDASFPTLEELKNYAQAWAKPRGYAIATERSKPGKVWLKCTRGGEYRNRYNLDRTSCQRKSNHKAHGCPFKLVGKLSGITEDWELSMKNGKHNHEPVMDPTALPQHRKLTATQIKDVERGTNKLEEEGLPFRKRVDNENRITSLIFTHPQSVSFTKRFRNVFVMDCTYKTNKFEMPLLHIVGMTCCNTSFTSALCFLSRETREDYLWAMCMYSELMDYLTPLVIVTDRELALMHANAKVFPTAAKLFDYPPQSGHPVQGPSVGYSLPPMASMAGGNLPMGAPGHQRFYGPPPGPPRNYFGPYGP